LKAIFGSLGRTFLGPERRGGAEMLFKEREDLGPEIEFFRLKVKCMRAVRTVFSFD
jgi:hypothetical protein